MLFPRQNGCRMVHLIFPILEWLVLACRLFKVECDEEMQCAKIWFGEVYV